MSISNMEISLKSVLWERDYFLDTTFLVINNYHCNKNTLRLLHIIAETKAYPIGIRDAAREKYLRDVWEVSSLAKLSKNEDFYESVQNPQRKITIESSSSNISWNKRFERVHGAYINMRKEPIPIDESVMSDEESEQLGDKEKMLSPIKQVEEKYIPLFDPYRKQQALQIKNKYSITKDFIHTTYQEILRIVSGSNEDCTDKIAVIKMIEIVGIESGLLDLYKDLGWFESYIPLSILRRNTRTGPNTICHSCGNAINLQHANHYCTQQLNRSCYEQRKRDEREREKEFKFARSNKKCVRCGQDAVYKKSRKIRKIIHHFCSKQCYESYRKKPKIK